MEMTTIDDCDNLAGRTFSITIRPLFHNFKVEWAEVLEKAFSKKKYVIGRENASSEEGAVCNHLQICVIGDYRPQNLRRKIQGACKFVPEHEAEEKSWMKVSKSDDPMYTIGYCCKEGDFLTNIPCLAESALEYWKERKEQGVGASMKWKCKGINSLLTFAKHWWEQEYEGKNYVQWRTWDRSKVESRRYPKLRTVCVRMHTLGLIPFSLARKVRREDEIFWEDMMDRLTIDDINLRSE